MQTQNEKPKIIQRFILLRERLKELDYACFIENIYVANRFCVPFM